MSDFLSSPVSVHTKSSQVNFVLFYVGPLELLLLVSLCCSVKVFNKQGEPFEKESKVHQQYNNKCTLFFNYYVCYTKWVLFVSWYCTRVACDSWEI